MLMATRMTPPMPNPGREERTLPQCPRRIPLNRLGCAEVPRHPLGGLRPVSGVTTVRWRDARTLSLSGSNDIGVSRISVSRDILISVPARPIRCLQYPFVAGRFAAVHKATSRLRDEERRSRVASALRHMGKDRPRRVAAAHRWTVRPDGSPTLQRSCVWRLANSALIAGCASPAIPDAVQRRRR